MNCKTKSFISKRKAFTLIELLIVIAIIGILFVVLVSKVDFATDKAKATGVQTDFRSFQVAIESVAKENAGLATFGWDTGDANGNRIRDSYDKGDTNQNGKQDPGEVFVGSKTYGETWTNVYTLTNPSDANDKSAIVALEEAINKNLDPKLHITIHDDLTITMANGAQDPWDTEYHGYYITNATVDNKDRGAIVIYSNGANQEFGSEHSISNGVVTVNVPGNNVYGKDDYSIAVIYTYVNGYGEVRTSTSGFSNNQTTQDNISNNSGTEDTEDPDVTELLEPGLYNAGAIALAENGDVEAAQDMIKTSWDDLLAAGIVHVTDGAVYGNLDLDTWENASSDALDGDLVLPNDGSITSIGDAFYDENYGYYVGNIAFACCHNLTGITIPKGVTSIMDSAFSDCTNLTIVNVPNSVTIIDDFVFAYCPSLTSITIGNGVTIIGDYAFEFCTSLVSVIIPNGVTSIGDCAFNGCSSLTNVVIPDGVTYIGYGAFDNCISLQYNEDEIAYYLGNNNNPYLMLVYVKDTNITSFNIHNNTRFIYSWAFLGCTNFTNIIIPDSVISIGAYAFQDCTSLTSVTIPDGVTSIYDYTFCGCTSLMSVIIPNGVTSIGDYAFYFCTNLTSVVIPDSVTYIGDSAFRNCPSLTSATIPDRVPSICDYTFDGCTNLTNVTIGNGVTSIGYMAFRDCDSLASVTIPDSVTSIGDYAFESCTNLTSVIIGSGVTSIANYAFWGCSSLTSITIPNSVTSIGSKAFLDCFRLANINFNGTKAEWSSISKGSDWNKNIPAIYVQCTDGQVTI